MMTRNRTRQGWIALWALLIVLPVAAAERGDVRLVLQVTVDQLRGDALSRFGDHFTQGGFRYLLKHGVYFSNAHYPYSDTETAPGHATLATGAYPAAHGIVSNDWIDYYSGAFVYNTEDDRHGYIGQQPKAHQGVSPRNLQASTFGDELVTHSAGRSRAFSVSAKDRGAILPGGHMGKAFWYDKRSGAFVTSTYYYDDYPRWVAKWNAARPADRFKGQSWDLLYERSAYAARNRDDRPFEADVFGLGRTFPHPLGDGSAQYFPVLLYLTPKADELSLDFARTLIDAEALGQGEAVDYLAVSFSAPDIAGHLYGQASLEYEDAVLRTDRNLAALLDHIDERIGLDKVLIALSADHGGVEAPEHMQSLGFPADRLPLDWIRSGATLAAPLEKKYGRDDLVAGHSHPYVYLNMAAVGDAGLNVAEVERTVADELMRLPGISFALTRSQIMAGEVPDIPLAHKIVRNFHPNRSGNVHYVQAQYWFVHSTEEAEALGLDGLAAIHGSPWRYDTFVPILFAGPGISQRAVSRRVTPLAIAPTLAHCLGVKPPSAATGEVLQEVNCPVD